MLFARDRRYLAGGFWRCAEKNRLKSRAYYAANKERLTAALRDRYDRDPIYRIGKRLADDRRTRRQSLNRRKAMLAEEG